MRRRRPGTRGGGSPSAPALALAIVMGLAAPAVAGGLRCSIGELVVENLAAGRSWSLRALANLPLAITNTGEAPVTVRVDPHVPGRGDLRHGAEPVGAASWGFAVPDSFALAAHGTRLVDLGLRIPDDSTLAGRTFEVLFWSHTMAHEGDMLAYGLDSRVIFSVAPPGAARGTVGSSEPVGDLALALAPAEIRLAVAPGRAYSLDDPLRPPLEVRNTSSRPQSVEVHAIRARDSASPLPEGCGELLDAATVTIAPERFTLAPGETKRLTGTVRFPRGGPRLAQPLMCVVSAAVVDQPVVARIYARIFAQAR